MIELTLSLIKPDSVQKKITGKIISMFEENGFNILQQQKITLTKVQAQHFYKIHERQPFFDDLIRFMSSGPIIAQVLQKQNAIMANRMLMGATNPKEAKPGTIRNLFGENIERNSVHGSDSINTAQIEISFFFTNFNFG